MTNIILVAFDLHPQWGSEAGYASAWLDIAARHFAMEVFTQDSNRRGIAAHVYPNATVRYIKQNSILEWLARRTGSSVVAGIRARLFFRAVKAELSKRKVVDAEIIHCITPAGQHAANDLYTLGKPIVIGPLGSGLPTPKGFEKAFRKQWLEPIVRNIAYRILRSSKTWQQYYRNAALVILGASLQVDRMPVLAGSKCIRIADALVDVGYFSPLENRLDNAVVRILFVGRLVGLKGPLLLIDAVRVCVQRGMRNFEVEIVGWGPLKDELLKAIDQDDLGTYVRLTGGRSREEVRKKFRESDIFCLPTLRESGGTAILEAMACGLPIITSDCGGPAYLVTQECGIRLPVTDYTTYVRELADALGHLIQNHAVRKQMGDAARKRAKAEFSLQALEEKILRAYRMVAN